MARMTGLPAATLRDALKGISGKRRMELIKVLSTGPSTGKNGDFERNVINLDVDKIPDTSQSDE